MCRGASGLSHHFYYLLDIIILSAYVEKTSVKFQLKLSFLQFLNGFIVNATQRNATQRNATQRNATYSPEYFHPFSSLKFFFCFILFAQETILLSFSTFFSCLQSFRRFIQRPFYFLYSGGSSVYFTLLFFLFTSLVNSKPHQIEVL